MLDLYLPASSRVHNLDARVKLILSLAFILAVSLTPTAAWPAYILLLALIQSAILLAHIPTLHVLKRALLAIPFVLAAFPLIFSGPSPQPLILLERYTFLYSVEGLARFASIAFKSWLSIQAAILLTSTTRFADLLLALGRLKLPPVFIAIIGLMWRYLFVLVEEVKRMERARSSRSASVHSRRSGGSLTWRAQVTGKMAGSLLLRALERSERIYAAMLARGYDGRLPANVPTALRPGDIGLLLAGFFVLLFLVLLGFLTGRPV